MSYEKPPEPNMAAPFPESILKNIRTVRELEAEFVRRRTMGERIADRITAFIGSFRFLAVELLVIVSWICLNLGLAPWLRPFDPYPFELLNFIVGSEAILLSTFVMMTQNRQSRQSDHWGHLQLQVSLLGEQESTKMLEMLRLVCLRLGLDKIANDPALREMIQSTHVEELAKELETARDGLEEEIPPLAEPTATDGVKTPVEEMAENNARKTSGQPAS